MKHKNLYIGIDPGKNGGISAITSESIPHSADRMPDTPAGLVDVLRDILTCADAVHCVVERVRSTPQMGVTSAFTFGQGYGRIESAIAALGIPYEEVLPQRWQKEIGCMSKGNKNVTKARAMAMFPAANVTHTIADSLLIAEYCRRLHR
jgi:Holliday junction resolvasome RuvABC endonuclease subunit